MMKDVIRDIATGNLPLIGVLAFVSAFVLILIRVFLLTKREITELEQLPLRDDFEELRPPAIDRTETA